jgi:pyridoxine 5-phosphate synthase
MSLLLGVNIDHVATLRQARYSAMADSHNCEPDVVAAAGLCEAAGAHGITAHLRADRRHIQDRDIERLRESIVTKLNLEMGNTPEILKIALRIVPEDVCMVPENRKEITTEGGLDVVRYYRQLEPTVRRLQSAGTRVSMFIDPDPKQVDASKKIGADAVELHTGAFANADGARRQDELEQIGTVAAHAHSLGLQVNAGHGINYTNIHEILQVPFLTELNIGHSIVSRALFIGLNNAVAEMLKLMRPYRLGPEKRSPFH